MGTLAMREIIKNHVGNVTKKGIMGIRDNHKWDERILALENQINYWIKHKPDKILEQVHLFYSH